MIYLKSILQPYLYCPVVSIPLLWISSAGSALFWIIGASAFIILSHAACIEPGVENEFGSQV